MSVLGCESPLMQAPLGRGAGALLASEVSRAGGLGTLGASWTDPAMLRDQIGAITRTTDRPFCVNLVLDFPQDERLEIALEEHVPWVSFSFGLDPELIARARRQPSTPTTSERNTMKIVGVGGPWRRVGRNVVRRLVPHRRSGGLAVAALVRHPLIDEILDARREYAHGDTAAFEGYRNHAHRVYNFARSIASFAPDDEDKTAIAAAFHDLCVFDGLDYIEPSIKEAARYLRETNRQEWDREVALMIAFHHRVRPYRGEHAILVEPFRRADWNDFTMGLVKSGIPRDVRNAAEAELPVSDFVPKALLRLTLQWLPRHPLRPAPVFRGGAALRRTGRG